MEKKGVIVIGGSAGSIDCILSFFPAIPENFPYPIVVVIHRKGTIEHYLEEVLNKKCKLKVVEIQDKMQMEGNRIYLAPGDYHLLVESSGYFCLDYSEKVNFSRPSIDVSFDGFAKAFGEQCIGILLSGASADGAIGLKSIKDSGGITIVQSVESSNFPAMPQSAIKLFSPDMILNPIKMAQLFIDLNQKGLSEFRDKLKMTDHRS